MKYAAPLGEAEDASYTDGNPEYGILGSVVPAKAVEPPQRELIKVIEEAGLTHSDNDLTQLYQAIVKIIGVKAPIATTKAPGLVQVGSGLDVTAAGLLSVLVATAARAGIIKPDGTSLTVDKNGVLSVIQKADATVTELDFLRKLSIGRPVWHTSTTLPDRHMWVNGDLIDFDAHPEFGEKFEAGGFAGLVMPWDADAEYQAAHLGQFRPNSANPSAVFSPLHGGQFFRNWALGNINDPGAYKADTFKSHYHNTKWNPDRTSVRQSGGSISSLPREDATYANTIIYGYNGATVYNFMEETGESETAPPHIWQPVILYLGQPK